MNKLKEYFGLTFWFLLVLGILVAASYWSSKHPLTPAEQQELTGLEGIIGSE
jgi:hypothetical protein